MGGWTETTSRSSLGAVHQCRNTQSVDGNNISSEQPNQLNQLASQHLWLRLHWKENEADIHTSESLFLNTINLFPHLIQEGDPMLADKQEQCSFHFMHDATVGRRRWPHSWYRNTIQMLMITEIESSIMFLPGNTSYAKLRYYPCTAQFHTCQPQGRALASSRKLMPRYLIHWILHHCVQIHIICAKMLVCSWKKKKNLFVKDALGHRDEEVIQGNKKKNPTESCAVLILFPQPSSLLSCSTISWQIFLTDNHVIKRDLQVYLPWGRKSDSSDYERLTDAPSLLHQEACTVWASLRFPSCGDSQPLMIYASSQHLGTWRIM